MDEWIKTAQWRDDTDSGQSDVSIVVRMTLYTKTTGQHNPADVKICGHRCDLKIL